MHTTCGTLNYIAPEIIKNTGYDGSLADIWATGVILYFMLTGHRPFDEESVHKLLDKIIIGEYTFPATVTLSDESKDLIRGILNPNPRKRFSITQIKEHKWFKTGGYEEDEMLSQIGLPPEFSEFSPELDGLSQSVTNGIPEDVMSPSSRLSPNRY